MKLKPCFLVESALLLKPDRILVVADLHLGIEYELFKDGINIPSQIEKIRKRLDFLLLEHSVKQLIFLGDIKHNIPLPSYQEEKEVPQFLNHFSRRAKVFIVKGNHDGNIERFAERCEIYDGSGFVIKNFGFAHGQSWIAPELLLAEYLVLAHTHPVVEFKDKLGFRSVERCWLRCPIDKKFLEKKYKQRCKIKEAIVMPVFNSLVGGIAVNCKDFHPLGPIFSAVNWKEGDVYLLDGTHLGKLEKLVK